nr:MAG TPA: hypothetical protein [Caudoviricetes sp.]
MLLEHTRAHLRRMGVTCHPGLLRRITTHPLQSTRLPTLHFLQVVERG